MKIFNCGKSGFQKSSYTYNRYINKLARRLMFSFTNLGIGHFRVPSGLCFKTRVGAQPFIWKSFFILMQIKLIFTRKVVHLASFGLLRVKVDNPITFLLEEKKIHSNKLNIHLSLMKLKFHSKKIMRGKGSSQCYFLGVSFL